MMAAPLASQQQLQLANVECCGSLCNVKVGAILNLPDSWIRDVMDGIMSPKGLLIIFDWLLWMIMSLGLNVAELIPSH